MLVNAINNKMLCSLLTFCFMKYSHIILLPYIFNRDLFSVQLPLNEINSKFLQNINFIDVMKILQLHETLILQ